MQSRENGLVWLENGIRNFTCLNQASNVHQQLRFLFYRQPDRCFCPAGGLPPWANRAIAEYDRAVHVILA